MVTYNYNKEKGYLNVVFSSKVNHGEIINYIGSLMKEDDLPRDLGVLIDARAGSVNINPANLYYILEENVKMFSKFNSLRVAIVVDGTINTALAVLYMRLIQLERYKFKTFSLMESAEEWVRKDVDQNRTYPKEIFTRSYSPL